MVDVADNELTTLDALTGLETVVDIWANDNKISSWAEVDKLAKLPNLEVIYLERNPIYNEVCVKYWFLISF